MILSKVVKGDILGSCSARGEGMVRQGLQAEKEQPEALGETQG